MVLPRRGDGVLEALMSPDAEGFERLGLNETFTSFAGLRCH